MTSIMILSILFHNIYTNILIYAYLSIYYKSFQRIIKMVVRRPLNRLKVSFRDIFASKVPGSGHSVYIPSLKTDPFTQQELRYGS